MKKLIVANILALALVLNPLAAMAQHGPQQAPAISDSLNPAQLRRVVNDVVYSIENIDQALNDIEKLAGGANGNQPTPAAGGLSKAVVAKIGERFTAAVELQSALMLDEKMDKATREGYINTLNGHLGALFFKILRFHGEDLLDINKKYQSPGAFKQALREILLDARTLVTFKRAAIDGQIAGRQVPSIVWGPVDRVRRNRLMNEILPSLNKLASETLPQIESERIRLGAGRDFWTMDVLEKSVAIRQERIWGQKIAAASYVGLSAIGFLAPFIDIVAIGNGFERTDLTLDASAQIYFTIWIVAGLMKAATFLAKGTKTTIKALEGVIELLKALPAEGQVKHGRALPERLAKISGEVRIERTQAESVARTCQGLF